MEVLHQARAARHAVEAIRGKGLRIGLVPTMGALHEGHLSLVRESRAACDRTFATIFVNPTQFGPSEDLDAYPRTLDADLAMLRREGVDGVFVPPANELYPRGFSTFVDPPSIARPLEGECRPGHFRGVCTIVLKLFQILPATHAFFGRKDYQQLKVIQAMVRDFDLPIEIVPCETVREADGLAMSSRNRYLDPEGRRRALALWQALQRAREVFRSGSRATNEIEAAMRRILETNPGGRPAVDRVDYAVVVDADDLEPHPRATDRPIALIAAVVDGTRLIDNLILS